MVIYLVRRKYKINLHDLGIPPYNVTHLVMKRVNTEYSNRVKDAIDSSVCLLKNGSTDDSIAIDLVDDLKLLLVQISDKLGITANDENVFRSDRTRFDCEQSTKIKELDRLETKLESMRQERQDRRDELEEEMEEVTMVFDEKKAALNQEQQEKERSEILELESQRMISAKELAVLTEKNDNLVAANEKQIMAVYAEEKTCQQTIVDKINIDIQTLQLFELEIASTKADVKSAEAKLKQEQQCRIALEEHFARVDANNAVKKLEDDCLRRVLKFESKASALLVDGAIALQKLFRGARDRAFVAKMKSKKKKKGGKGGKEKKKK